MDKLVNENQNNVMYSPNFQTSDPEYNPFDKNHDTVQIEYIKQEEIKDEILDEQEIAERVMQEPDIIEEEINIKPKKSHPTREITVEDVSTVQNKDKPMIEDNYPS